MEKTARTIAAYDTGAAAFAERWFDFRLEKNVNRFAAHLRPGARILGVGRDVCHFQELGFDAAGCQNHCYPSTANASRTHWPARKPPSTASRF